MPLTRTQDTAALKYIIETVLNQPVDGPITKSLTYIGFDYVTDLPSLRDADILTMRYSADDGTLTALSLPYRGRLTAFCAFMRYRTIQSSPIGDNWTSITREEFDAFRVNPYFDGTIFGSRYPKATSLRHEPLVGKTSTPIIESRHGSNEFSTSTATKFQRTTSTRYV
jgi:hypothetical protein